jgi:hypothetical protein
VDGWPAIEDRELLERLGFDDARFDAYVESLLSALPAREYEPSVLARALAYPWARPRGPYVLRDGAAAALDEIDAARREALIEGFAADPRRRPVLAIGSNGAPEQLSLKFAHFADAEDRTALVLTGWLDDFEVGAAAQPTLYGAMPATIFPSPGTRVRAALLWVTSTQFTQLAWTEMSYRLGRLRTDFEVDDSRQTFDEVLVFVSRFGAFHRGDGEPVALAAVAAEGRTAAALEQEEILDAAAAMALGPGAGAETLVRAAFSDPGGLAAKLAATVRRSSIAFESERWTPFSPSS